MMEGMMELILIALIVAAIAYLMTAPDEDE